MKIIVGFNHRIVDIQLPLIGFIVENIQKIFYDFV